MSTHTDATHETTADLANELNTSKSTILNWANSGRIPVLKCSPRILRFNVPEVLAALRNN